MTFGIKNESFERLWIGLKKSRPLRHDIPWLHEFKNMILWFNVQLSYNGCSYSESKSPKIG